MKPKIFQYHFRGSDSLAVIKNGFVVDIACSEKDAGMFSEENCILKKDFYAATKKHDSTRYITKIKPKDLALYTYWPVHTKEFWDLLNET